jgi:hypothetical protein
MKNSTAALRPHSWSSPSFPTTVSTYDILFFPGGHDSRARQVFDSPIVQQAAVSFFPSTLKSNPSGGPKKAIASICHGVLVLAYAKKENGKSVLEDVETTTLPGAMEGLAYWGTRLFLGDYYKTYGAGSENTEETVSVFLYSSFLFSPSENEI